MAKKNSPYEPAHSPANGPTIDDCYPPPGCEKPRGQHPDPHRWDDVDPYAENPSKDYEYD